MVHPTFKIEFNDGQLFTGDTLKGDWNKIPETPIKRLVFSFGGISVELENYRRYNHLIEKVKMVGGATAISKFLIMASIEKTTHIYEFNLQTRRANRRQVDIGQEYGGQVITGWKEGVKEGQPRFRHGKF